MPRGIEKKKQGKRIRKRSTNWCFTLNNPTDQEWMAITALTRIPEPKLRYICMSMETGESGTPHIQGYIQLLDKQRKGLRHVKGLIGKRVHLEIAKGTATQNLIYTTKECGEAGYKHFVWGVARKERERTDLRSIRELQKRGHSFDWIVRNYEELYPTLARYHSGIERCATSWILPRDKNSTTQGVWYYGDSGAGKSFAAVGLAKHLGYSDEDIYWKSDSSKWWPRYIGQRCVIWDDIRPAVGLGAQVLLRCLDTGDHQVQFKGKYVHFRSELIIFTCPFSPSEFWIKAYPGELPEQILRRLGDIVAFRGRHINGDVARTIIK